MSVPIARAGSLSGAGTSRTGREAVRCLYRSRELVACQAREPPARGGRRRGACSDRVCCSLAGAGTSRTGREAARRLYQSSELVACQAREPPARGGEAARCLYRSRDYSEQALLLPSLLSTFSRSAAQKSWGVSGATHCKSHCR